MTDRHRFRANWHNYDGGIYFVTICTRRKTHLFGRIRNNEMHLSALGKIVETCIESIPQHHNCEVWNHVIMPNHIHMVLAVGAQYIAPAPTKESPAPESAASPRHINTGCLRPPRHGDPASDNHFNSALAVVIRTFKAVVSRKVRVIPPRDQSAQGRSLRAQCIAPLQDAQTPMKIWQRNYHEHIIRDQWAFDNIMNYIDTNVENWHRDCFNVPC